MRKISLLNWLFIAQLLIIGFVITGLLPRLIIPFWAIILAVYVLGARLEDGVIFFARSIPFFVAIPITAGFDSLNTWRILSTLIFLCWLAPKFKLLIRSVVSSIFNFITIVIKLNIDGIKDLYQRAKARHATGFSLYSILVLAFLSVFAAPDFILAVKRLIYFINLFLIGIVIYDLAQKNQNFAKRLIKNIAIPTVIVALVGMAQLASTYFMDIFQFVDFWAGKVELGLFGSAWANIALKANTWFSYYGDQLSLRMFSLFPDSHSFPIFLLLGLPAVFAISFAKLFKGKTGLKSLIFKRASIWVLFIPLAFLAAILSGTRGIWLAGVASGVWAVFLICRHRKSAIADLRCRQHWQIFQYISVYLILFFLLFGIAYFIFASSQFQVSKASSAMFGKRVKSVIDISETSNARRLEIWRDSIKSTIKHPLLGVGIGNFPVVVGEDLAQAKAGSSAHNLYLHIAAEMGIPALLAALCFLWLLLVRIYKNFLKTESCKLETVYFASLLIFLPWVLIYSLTDVAIFDERAFLLFVTTIALIFGRKKTG
jgi:O-antigen ligase